MHVVGWRVTAFLGWISLCTGMAQADENPCHAAAMLLSKNYSYEGVGSWLAREEKKAMDYLLQNVSPPNTKPGVVVASPSNDKPDYFYHWVRDAALVMDPVVNIYRKTGNEYHNKENWHRLMAYIDFSRENQIAHGEPKFLGSGLPFTGPWARPQNDGPALRASTLIRLAHAFLDRGQNETVKEKLYNSKMPAETVIKADLEYTAHHWREKNWDLWEEVKGMHFYTLMVQRRAMIDGAALAKRLGDEKAAEFYSKQVPEIEAEIRKQWNSEKGQIDATRDQVEGIPDKESNLDIAVILGVLHGHTHDEFFSASSDAVLSTASKLQKRFQSLYEINNKGLPGIAIGRYPEDTWDGYQRGKPGHPWVLATHAFAELHYKVANEISGRGRVEISELNVDFYRTALGDSSIKPGQIFEQESPKFREILAGLRKSGDMYLVRTKLHAHPDGTMSEQINRESGFMEGAKSLTWNYASLLTAINERNQGAGR